MMASVGTVVIEVDANTAKLIDGVKKSQKQLSKLQKTANKAKSDLANFAKAAISIYAIAKAFEAAKNMAVSFVETSAKFEQFETTLTSITGSSKKAEESMKWITDFTSQTPFQLDQVTSAFVKMKAYGIDPTNGTLKTLGDTASAMGKGINQAVEAMADAITGENERLKEFGIKAKKSGEEITYAWSDSSGQAREIVIENNKDIIESTLNAIFNEKYVGAMDAQSKTWNGIISNMKDEWTVFQKSVMDEGLFTYLKAMAMTVKEVFATMFGKGQEGAKAFSETVIKSINSAIETFGWLGDAIDGIKLAFKAVEYAVLGMSRIVMEALNYPMNKINEIISLYNIVVSTLGGTSIQIPFVPTIDTTWTDTTMATLKKEMGELVTSLAEQDGVNGASSVIAKINKNLEILNETQEESNGLKDDAIDKLSQLGAAYIETGLSIGMATNEEMEKLYADELLSLGLDAQGDELEDVNEQLKEASGLYGAASGAAGDYSASIDNITDSLKANQTAAKGGYSTVTTLGSPQDYYDNNFDLPDDYYTNSDYDRYPGYANGGYTGDVGVNDIAGVVHGKEYVVDAKTTADLGLNGSSGVFKEISSKLNQLSSLYEMGRTLKHLLSLQRDTNALLNERA